MTSIKALVSITILLATIAVGTTGIRYLEQGQSLTWVEALYFTVVTITTVGYGDFIPQTEAGRLFSIAVIVVGVSSALSSLTLLFGPLLEDRLRRAVSGFTRPTEYKEHVILCGRGPLIDIVAKELSLSGVDYVRVVRMPEGAPEDAIVGDPTEEATLLKAGINRAISLVTLLEEDADNAFVILEAKRLEPHVRIITVVRDPANKTKLEEIGADMAIASDFLSARLLALSSENHFSLDFLDSELSSRSIALSEISIPENSPVVGKTLAELEIPKRFSVSVVAISKGKRLEANPDPAVALEAGGEIVVFGERSKALELKAYVLRTGARAPRRFAPPKLVPRKPLAHEIRMRVPRIVTNAFVITVILVLNQLISPIFSAAALTYPLQRALAPAVFVIVWAAIGYLTLHIISDLKVLVDLGVLRAVGLGALSEAGGIGRLARNGVFIAIVVVLGAVVAPVLGTMGGLAAWVGRAIPWISLVLILVVLYDVGSFLHSVLKGWVRRAVDGYAKKLEEAA